MKRPGYMMVKEAAVQYGVSRAKIHRLIQLGRLRTLKDPRDERVTLLRTEDMEALFRFPIEEAKEMSYEAEKTGGTSTRGRLTAELCARMDALRMRVSGGKRFSEDSVDIIRRERAKRSRQLDEALGGARRKARPQK